MANQIIKKIFKEKNILNLYHANTMETACTFLENGGLLSRGAVEDRGLHQSSQKSDKKDKEVDVFYDIFFDSVDIHQRRKNLNHYGPVLFVYSIDLIDALPENIIKITKDNPMYWDKNMLENQKYFLSKYELSNNFFKGRFAQQITLRHQTEPLKFDYLEQIIIDDPSLQYKTYLDSAYNHLKSLINKYNLSCSLNIRKCPVDCRCQNTYEAYKSKAINYKFGFQENKE